jgi:hypothetical protein
MAFVAVAVIDLLKFVGTVKLAVVLREMEAMSAAWFHTQASEDYRNARVDPTERFSLDLKRGKVSMLVL